jgi:O-acetyl-ADP-ribose deacetylase (regulator of RNase III)
MVIFPKDLEFKMPSLHYLIGDATDPINRPAMIIHICNNAGGFGKGFVVPLAEKYPEVKRKYKEWYATGTMKLGMVQFVQVEPKTDLGSLWVGNMIAQAGIRWQGSTPPIRYEALNECLKLVYDKASKENLTIHMPRIGAVLSGGDWEKIEKIILANISVESYVYS